MPGQHCVDAPAAAPGTGLDRPAVDAGPFAHTDEPLACAPGVGHGDGRTLVDDLDLETTRKAAHGHVHPGRARRVPQRVRQRLLRDPVHRELEPGVGRQRAAQPLGVDRQPGRPEALDELLEVHRARLGRERRAVLDKLAEHASHVRERGPSCGRELVERRARPVGRTLQGRARTVGQGDHDREAVRDDVVHLSCDPRPLGGPCELRLLVPVPCDRVGPVDEVGDVQPPVPHADPDRDGGERERDDGKDCEEPRVERRVGVAPADAHRRRGRSRHQVRRVRGEIPEPDRRRDAEVDHRQDQPGDTRWA